MTPESIGLKKARWSWSKHSGRHAFEERLQELGFHHLSADDVNDAFQKFKDLADKKKVVTDSDIEAWSPKNWCRYLKLCSLSITMSPAAIP